ncbi:Tumor necrosis factor ligand superfamily member 9 [Galemys pyrenaicus]|uniref:Tumor necrosis factor ligand superfamily member 9 n=1 Tax=Galemys pyrenaicus TaxID=202257 RepID=A0A8J6ADJ2_GALPY|nr:Tumor necrosis factor ligand superfamily member 9 [Galemys pyrenaicus]
MPCLAEAAQDPEAQRSPEPCGRACRPLLWALSAALLLLSGTFAAFVTRTWILPRDPDSPREDPAPSPTLPEEPRDPCASRHDPPQGMFAQLVAVGVLLLGCRAPPSCSSSRHFPPAAQLKNGPVAWRDSSGMEGVYLQGLTYDRSTKELEVGKAGLYYVFLRLELQRVMLTAEDPGPVSVSLRLKTQGLVAEALASTVNLPTVSAANSAVTLQSGLLRLKAHQRLGVHLEVSKGQAIPHWHLSQTTVLGVFRILNEDDDIPSELFLKHST